MSDQERRLGFIINPIAGLGGRVGLKGSDGLEIQRKALALGATPQAGERARLALQAFYSICPTAEVITCSGEMGEAVARQCGFDPQVVMKIKADLTTAQDTERAAQAMQEARVDLLLFAGGDGTACDIYRALKLRLPVLGIPAGVKIHSAVFARHPRLAGELAAQFLQGGQHRLRLQEAEVMDQDEDAYRSGLIVTELYGYLKVPFHTAYLQNRKVPTPAAAAVQAEAIAWDMIENMQVDTLYILGPGTTTRLIASRLGVGKTLAGVDVVTSQGMLAEDVNEAQLLKLIADRPACIVVTPIGGQGFIFGRGNQPISPKIIRAVGKANLIVVSTPDKLNSLSGRPLLVDTGDDALDANLAGPISVVTGYGERAVYRVSST